ncbi:MAG: class I tRNA ligase family protein [archaeon]
MERSGIFKNVPSELDFPLMEHRILEFWTNTKAFEKRVALNRGKPNWSFIDGPITANNPMGVHHAWGRTYKDLFQRYKAMRGFQLRYQNGFDCQGLWIEVEVEKELGFKTKRDTEAYGAAEFVKKCKQRALKFAAVQTEQSVRLGYWMDWGSTELLQRLSALLDAPNQVATVPGRRGAITDTVENLVGRLGTDDFGGSYFTLSNENNYSIWAALKKCYEKKWIYNGRDVMPWCPRCATALSEHEIVTEGYRELTHYGLTLSFPIRGRQKEYLLVWTTTPWTLSSNVAVAVHPLLTYVKIRFNGEIYYLAKAALQSTLSGKYEILEELNGAALEGVTYTGPFDELPAIREKNVASFHQVILWDGVSETEGTGMVHIAPGCGKEDFELGERLGLPAVAPLDEFGVFEIGFSWLSGLNVYETPTPIIKNLKEKGFLFKSERYVHRYPVCWRCESELVFRLVDEWFISMGEKLSKAVEDLSSEELENNLRYQIMLSAKQSRWMPEYNLELELDWLHNMDDWMISKKRIWGLALPIWECKNCGNFEVIGSEEELEKRAVSGWDQFKGHSPHKPWIDNVKIACSKCGRHIERIRDVGNPWLDAGIVAYSTLRYRDEREYWSKWFPAELILESFPGQFRNWFYSMLAMSTIMERRSPFLMCFGHGLVLAEDGREMHKSTGTAIWFDEAVEKIGADVMRWIYCTSKPEGNLLFGYGRAEEARRRFLIPLWNIYSFFVTYANLDGWRPTDRSFEYSLLDRWILSKLQTLISGVTERLDAFDPMSATQDLESFVEELSTWYVRRSRRRFWKSDSDADKEAAYVTLYTCLVTLVKLLAPFIPFVTEEMHLNLVKSIAKEPCESVHHNDWPLPQETLIDAELVSNMELAISVSRLGRAARSKAGIKLRQPLKSATIVSHQSILERLRPLSQVILDELNVREIAFSESSNEIEQAEVSVPPELGKRVGRMLPKIQETIAIMKDEVLAKIQANETMKLRIEDKDIELRPGDVQIQVTPRANYSVEREGEIAVGILTSLTDELKTEGLARDIVRRIQDQRKSAGFNIDDRIEIRYQAGPLLRQALTDHADYISKETLADTMEEGAGPSSWHKAELELNGENLILFLSRRRS